MENEITLFDNDGFVQRLSDWARPKQYSYGMVYAMGYWFAQEDYDDIVKWCKGDED